MLVLFRPTRSTKPTVHPHARIYSTARSCLPCLTVARFSVYTSERDGPLRHTCMLGILALHILIPIPVIIAVALRSSNVPRIISQFSGFSAWRMHSA